MYYEKGQKLLIRFVPDVQCSVFSLGTGWKIQIGGGNGIQREFGGGGE